MERSRRYSFSLDEMMSLCVCVHVCVHPRTLHWVTIEMLCVSMDEEIPEVSDNVVKAITGQLYCHIGKLFNMETAFHISDSHAI